MPRTRLRNGTWVEGRRHAVYKELPLRFAAWAYPRRKSQPHQIREASRLHLFHQMGAMDFDSARRDIEFIGNDLIGPAGDKVFQYLALAGRQLSNPTLR